MKKYKYPLALFKLQSDFAGFLTHTHELELDDVLFSNTFFYVRCIGHSDEHLPDKNNSKWQKMISEKPSDNLGEYFYQKYQEFEDNKAPPHKRSNQKPCFHAYFHNTSNAYELHFDPNDSQGNLSKDRMPQRLMELKDMVKAISISSNERTVLFVRTWLLNIEAFNRLFPQEFSQSAVLWDSNNKTYDNAQWGQFITKDGEFRSGVADTFRDKWGSKEMNFNSYFPYPALRAEITVSDLVKYYESL